MENVILVFVLAITLLVFLVHLPSRIIQKQNFKCYVISLPKNSDRLENFRINYSHSELADVPLVVINGVNGKALGPVIKKYVTPEVAQGMDHVERTGARPSEAFLTRGAIGCYLSHFKTWETILDSTDNFGAVFEDDAVIDPRVYSKGFGEISKVNWDIILLGNIFTYGQDVEGTELKKVTYFWGLQGYLISREGCKKLMKYRNEKISKQIDAYVSSLAQDSKLEIWAVPTSLVNQANFGTDIQVPIA
jgi:GR25 family glycosyltransferase involved in LPS biosynthesis